MIQEHGAPFTGNHLQRVKSFLSEGGLIYDQGIEFTVNLLDNDYNIIATGSIQENVLKCIRVDEMYQGEGLTGTLLTSLVQYAFEQGRHHLFLFTKPQNGMMFTDSGFYNVAQTPDVLLLENKRGGIRDFVASLQAPVKTGNIGSIVMNCNPFTYGHLYLIEKAASACDLVHIFILSEDKSVFPAKHRYTMVQQGVAHLPNVLVHPTADYLISSATFPTYFMKDYTDASAVNCALDFTIFLERFATPLGIVKRFVGTEPFCDVTSAYNRQMKVFFAGSSVQIIEIPRHAVSDTQISASQVRRLLAEGKEDEALKLVPASTNSFLHTPDGRDITASLQALSQK